MTRRLQLAYVTLNGRIPSGSANSVGVMNMCGQFAVQGLETLLVIPDGLARPLTELGFSGDLMAYYSVPAPFKIKRFPNYYSGRLVYFRQLYSLALAVYLRLRRIPLILSRNLETAYWAAFLGLSVIFESHNYSKYEQHRLLPAWVRMTRKAEKRVSMVVTTHAGKLSYAGRGVPESSIMVLPNGVDTKRFTSELSKEEIRRSLGIPENKITVTFCGSLHEGRGIEEVLDCASRLRNAHFIIVGGATEQVRKYRKDCVDKRVRNVEFSGHVPQRDVPAYLLASDVLLMPYTTRFAAHSFEYTSPMKMFEYLAAGVPMVATDFPVLHEILKHGRNAIFVKPDSGEYLAQGIQTLLADSEYAAAIGSTARADAEKYSWETRARTIIEWQRQLGNIG